MRQLVTALLLIFIATAPAHAAPDVPTVTLGQMQVGLAYWNNVSRGFRQVYRVQIRPADEPIQDAYILLFVYDATDITNVQSTAGMDCAQHGIATVAVLCSVETLTDTQTLTINGVITGPATNNIYAQLRVGFAELGTADRGLALVANYHEDEPTAVDQANEPGRNTIYLPEVRK